MKKTLFVKFLFLLLCGSVLTTAGCKDYDDDIDALRNDEIGRASCRERVYSRV